MSSKNPGEVFTGVVEVDDMNGSRKVRRCDGFIVAGTVGENDDFVGLLAAPRSASW